jgi:hypothetical protein
MSISEKDSENKKYDLTHTTLVIVSDVYLFYKLYQLDI